MDRLKSALQYFLNEIKQCEQIIHGKPNKAYTEHIQEKITYYKIAIDAIIELQKREDDLK